MFWEIKKIAKWLGKTQGRDKLCKILQHLFRLLSGYYAKTNEYKHLKFYTLFGKDYSFIWVESLQESRKLFRIFKSIDQYEVLIKMIFHGNDDLGNFLRIISRFFYFWYWAFDNISVAAQIKFLPFNNFKINQIALYIRACGILFSILAYFYELRNKHYSQQQKVHRALEFIKECGDMLHTGKDSGIIQKVFHLQLSQTVAASGGLISAFIATYQIYKAN